QSDRRFLCDGGREEAHAGETGKTGRSAARDDLGPQWGKSEAMRISAWSIRPDGVAAGGSKQAYSAAVSSVTKTARSDSAAIPCAFVLAPPPPPGPNENDIARGDLHAGFLLPRIEILRVDGSPRLEIRQVFQSRNVHENAAGEDAVFVRGHGQVRRATLRDGR